jgi:Xaa-Pro dipeptidase
MDLAAIQKALRERNFDAWLFYDHHHRDPIAYRVLGLPGALMVTRRWFYLIPAKGDPLKLVHKIEAGHLDSLPGEKRLYAGWQELFDKVKSLLGPYRNLAMQYSPNNIVFTVSLVDAGTIDMIRGMGKNVISSADLVAQFEATWTEEQITTHFAARHVIDNLTTEAFREIGRRVRGGGTYEHEMQQWFMEAFSREDLTTDDPPIVAVNANSGNPHYEPGPSHPVPIREGDFVLLDVWAKKNTPGAVYYDITWTGVVGGRPSDRQLEVFNVVTEARDLGVQAVQDSVASHRPIAGWEVDRAVRGHIKGAGFGDYFIHRTGHSIGIYLPEFGVRSEVNVLVRPGIAEVTGKIQREIVII